MAQQAQERSKKPVSSVKRGKISLQRSAAFIGSVNRIRRSDAQAKKAYLYEHAYRLHVAGRDEAGYYFYEYYRGSDG